MRFYKTHVYLVMKGSRVQVPFSAERSRAKVLNAWILALFVAYPLILYVKISRFRYLLKSVKNVWYN